MSAGLLVARASVRRWAVRAAVALTATVALALVAAPAVAAVFVLLQAL
jgi:hypothetical protein